MYICMNIYIYIHMYTYGFNTNGAAARVNDFDGLGKKLRPGTFGNTKVDQRECPKSPSFKKP